MVLSREETLAAHKAAAWSEERGVVQVLIAYGAVKNRRDEGCWAPMVWECGRELRSSWISYALTKAEAEQQSRAIAEEHASRFLGDYAVTLVAVS